MLFFFSFCFLPVLSVRAQSDVYIKLGAQGQTALLNLGLPPFSPAGGDMKASALAAAELHKVVRADLLFSRYFNVLEEGPPYDGKNQDAIAPAWRQAGASWLLTADIVTTQGGEILATATLLDANSGAVIYGRRYRAAGSTPRTLAHRISDEIVKALTGKSGIAESKIAFSNNQTGHREIYVMDYDGYGLKRVTSDRSIDLLPRFSPDGGQIAYTSYRYGNPDLLLLDLKTGKTRVLSNDQGLNIAGGFSPDGQRLLMTLSREQMPNLYVKNLADGSLSRLTRHSEIDSSPTFSPDASQVAFVSDRAGNPEIFLMNMTTRKASRLTSINWCDSPAWSPTGEWIAFSGRLSTVASLDIFLVDLTGSQLRPLTHGEGSNEDPQWSSDGRFLVFTSTREGGRSRVFIMDSDGSAPHVLADIPGSSSTPSWSN